MANNKSSKSFSFTVAKSTSDKNKPAKARDGVAVAGCSLAPDFVGGMDYRYNIRRRGDSGQWC